MQVYDIQYLTGVNYHKNTVHMHDLKANFDKILTIVNQTLSDFLNPKGNLQFHPHKPGFPDSHIIALSLIQEALGIDSEHWLWGKLTTDYWEDFQICLI